MQWIGEHPVLTGLLGGLAVVAVATISAPGALAAAPMQVGILSLAVVAVWMSLLYMMQDFFRRQAKREVADSYRLRADADGFDLQRNDSVLVAVDDPRYDLFLPPEVTPSEERPQEATPVWLAIRGPEETYVVETMVTADEARQYPRPEKIEKADRELPIHLASGLLQLADRAG